MPTDTIGSDEAGSMRTRSRPYPREPTVRVPFRLGLPEKVLRPLFAVLEE
jgi:hypothetical protein